MARQEVENIQERFAVRRQVRMTEDDDQFLKDRSRVTGISPSWQIRDALRVYRSFYLPGIAVQPSKLDVDDGIEAAE